MVRAQKGEQGFFARGFTIGVKGRVRSGVRRTSLRGELSCSLSLSPSLTQVLPHPLHPLPAQGSEDPGR